MSTAPPPPRLRPAAATPRDETREPGADPAGGLEGLRGPYRVLAEELLRRDPRAWGPAALRRAAEDLHHAQREAGVVFTARIDGELVEQPFPLDPVPRLVTRAEWEEIAAGVEQRTLALNRFLDDVHTAGDGPARIVADGVVPAWVVERSPGYVAAEVGGPHRSRPARAVVAGLDLLRDAEGRWRVLEDNLRVPSGLGYALALRRSARRAVPHLHAAAAGAGMAPRPLDDVAGLLLQTLRDVAPARPASASPTVVVLSDGPGNTAWFEHRLLAAEMGVAVVVPRDLHADGDRVVADVGGTRVAVDVCYRRLDEADLPSLVGGDGLTLDVLLGDAVRAGTLAIANALGNGVGDDKATYAWVPQMIDYYLGERPLLAQVPTWVLAEASHHAGVRERLAELVVKPVDGYGGRGVVFGPHLDEAGLRELQREVDAAPHRFIAQEPVLFSTHPTFDGDRLAPRHVDLRVFVVAGRHTVAVPAPLTRVAGEEGSLLVNSSTGGGSKDTWLV